MSSSGSIGGKTKVKQSTHHVHYPFWFGGSSSCFAATVTHPLDLSKYQQALSARRSLLTFFSVKVCKFELSFGIRAQQC